MDFCRRAVGILRLERVTIEGIRQIMEVPIPIADDFKTGQMKWYVHVQQNEDPKQVLLWTLQGRRRRERSRSVGGEGVDDKMEERGLTEGLWRAKGLWKLGFG